MIKAQALLILPWIPRPKQERARKLLNKTRNLAEKKDIFKTLVVPGRKGAPMQKIRSWEALKILHKVLDT